MSQNYKIKDVRISDIKPGDTVIHDDKMMTVCAGNIKHDACMGVTLFGDSYRLGNKSVKLVVWLTGATDHG